MTTILLVDDHQIVIDGLRNLLAGQPGLDVVAVAHDGRTAVKLAVERAPDVVVIDVGLPDLNGIEATRQIRELAPKSRVVCLSMHSDPRFVTRMLHAGASGYLLKDAAFDQLADAIRRVASGQAYLSPSVAGTVIEQLVRSRGDARSSAETVLSAREREVLQLIAEGVATRDIAARLVVSVKTVETHRKQIMDKLGLRSVAELTKYAIREGITSADG